MADTVEDVEEERVDDIDTNKTADPDAAEADWKSKITLVCNIEEGVKIKVS